MKSTQRPSKPPKHQPEPNYQSPNPKPELVAYRPVEQHQASSQPDSSKSDQPPQVEPEHQVIANELPLPLEKDKAERVYARERKSNSPQQSKPQRQFTHSDEEELPPQQCQHMQFMDCDKPVGYVVFECWHCKQGLVSEFSGEPAMGEYKGRPSVVLAKVQCPSCGETGIRLNAEKVLSTTAISSPWK